MSIITCPSGLVGKIRHITGAELKLLSKQDEIEAGVTFNKILENCWLETEQPGPYETKDGVLDWDAVLTADRFYSLIQIRIETHGNIYDFKVPCDSKKCRGKKFWWDLPLHELPVKKLPESSVETFRKGNRFEFKVGDDTVIYRLNVGADEKSAIRMIDDEPDLIEMLATRIVGVRSGGKETSGRREVEAYLEKLSGRVLTEMFDEFEEVDGGVDTELEVFCPRCKTHKEINLPFNLRFFLPRSRRRNSARQ